MTKRNDKAFQALQELGETKYAIAEHLRVLGITGRPQMPLSCPIAQYLKNEGFEKPSVSVYAFSLNRDLGMDNPEAIREFILAFDRYEFPDLVTTK